MLASAAVRVFVRSTSARSAAARLSSGAKTSPFQFSATKPPSRHILRCPVELSVCLDSIQPFHTVTASALVNSTFVLSRRIYCWLPEGS